jgi:hypothetical protein
MMEQPKFFVLERPRPGTSEDKLAGTDAMPEKGFKVGDAPKCPQCDRFIGPLEWLPPYRVEIETWGQVFGDIVITSGKDMIVSERFRDIYERIGLKGLSGFSPVGIVKITRHRKLNSDAPAYFKANVIRSQATRDQEGSECEWSENGPMCPVCLFPAGGLIKRWKKVAILPETWQGEDIFVPRGGGGIITSMRFKEVCEGNKIKNAILIPAENHAHDFYPWEKSTGKVPSG